MGHPLPMPNVSSKGRMSIQAGARGARILVLDDSALIRHILSAAGMRVDQVTDPIAAAEKIRQHRPDALVLDVELPRTDWLSFLRQLMSEADPIPTLICANVAGPGSERALQALENGAVGLISKLHLGTNESARAIVDTVRGALRVRLQRRGSLQEPRAPHGPWRSTAPARSACQMVAVGASTGGTEALRQLLERLPSDSPSIVIAQHMPEVFTTAFAKRLHDQCRIEVKEAEQGDRLCPGRALVAPGDHHLAVRRQGAEYFAEIRSAPPGSRRCPSVDVLFRSAALAAGPNAIGVILTGAGSDGARGLLEMRRAGAHTIAQDDTTSMVFDMPKEAIAAGAACEVLPLPNIAAALLERGS